MSQFTEQNGGPAFPINLPGSGDNGWGGMTLRDWFAGQALAALILADGAQFASNQQHREQHSLDAYEHADAMLKARSPL